MTYTTDHNQLHINGAGGPGADNMSGVLANSFHAYNTGSNAAFLTDNSLAVIYGSGDATFLSLKLNNGGSAKYVQYQTNGFRRFAAGTDDPESGTGNSGSNFQIHRYADDGTWLGMPFSISRATGATYIPGLVLGKTAPALPGR